MNLSINKRNYQKERHEESFHISVFRVHPSHRNPFANGPHTKKQKQTFYKSLFYKSASNSAPSTRIRIFLDPQLFLSGYENIRVNTLCDHSVFKSNSPVHTYSDSLRIHWGLTRLSHQELVSPGLTQNRRGRHCFPPRLSCFCRRFCAVDNVKSLQISSRLLA